MWIAKTWNNILINFPWISLVHAVYYLFYIHYCCFIVVFFLFASFLVPIFYEKRFFFFSSFPCSFMICLSWRFILLEIINYWRNPFIVGTDKDKLFNWIEVYSKCWSNWIQFWMEYWIGDPEWDIIEWMILEILLE